ncbi:GNAT family N-acetyltransferase [bacterium]|nr:GNAT family N-acetyltransferase [bacterium]
MQAKIPLQIKNLSKEEFQEKKSLLVDVYFSAYKSLPEYAYDRRKSVKNYLDWLYKGDPSGFFVAIANSELVGFIACHSNWEDYREGKVCEIHEFAVSQEWQGKGIGKALLEHALEYAQSKGLKKITLWVGEKNEKAIEMYKKAGFVPLYKAGIWLRMKKLLP